VLIPSTLVIFYLESIVNIFILSDSTDPHDHFLKQASMHIDKHVVKMIAESTQMLVTSFFVANSPLITQSGYMPASVVDRLPCKPLGSNMRKHPCTEWTCASKQHVNYLCQLAIALVNEHQYRYPLSPEHAYAPWLRNLATLLADEFGLDAFSKLPETFAVAVKSVELRSVSTPHMQACDIYRDYYFADKILFASWKRRNTPLWWLAKTETQQVA
jgi:hypothetical protein